ncbi:MAG: FlgD immunoglobulin-like domain containing protein [Thermoleophilaceae bacterium]
MQSSRLVRAVFAALVLATAVAFVLTQALKTEIPVVLRFATAPLAISPNGDSVRDEATVGFDLTEPAEVSFSIIDRDGAPVRELVDDEELAGDAKHRYTWNGRDDDGEVVPDGTYRMRVVRRKEGRIVNSYKTIEVDTRPPRVTLRSATPGVVDPSGGEPVSIRIRYRGPRTAHPELRVWRTDAAPPEVVRRFRGGPDRSGTWNGRDSADGELVPDGDYAFQVRVRDRAGNETLAPPAAGARPRSAAPGPPSAAAARPGTGVAVRRLTLVGPLTVVAAGSVARLEVGPDERPFRFALTRLGSPKEIRDGRRSGGALRVHLPDDARTGVYVVRVRSRGREAAWPLAVAGLPPRGVAPDRPRPLVVLPAITWQGASPHDSDLDGFAETLRDAGSIPVPRPLANGRMPPRFAGEISPLLRFLDRARLAYDLTTDLALARGEGPALGNAPGIAIAGTATWLPRGVRDRLREEVERHGKPAIAFGAASLRRTVDLDGGRLRFPSPPRPDDLFGERTELESVEPPAPLSVERDRLGLLEGVDGLFGEFGLVERSVSLPDDARLLTGAGREPGEPAFVAYRLGEGIVLRPGTPEWARRLEERTLDDEVPAITRRVWRLLGRG